jgi:hypothetical protein
MSEIIQLQSIADLHKLFNLGNSQHPLVALDFSQVSEQVNQNSKISTDFIQLCLKTIVKNNIKYGRKAIDFQDGNLICIVSNQTIEIDNEIEHRENIGVGFIFTLT